MRGRVINLLSGFSLFFGGSEDDEGDDGDGSPGSDEIHASVVVESLVEVEEHHSEGEIVEDGESEIVFEGVSQDGRDLDESLLLLVENLAGLIDHSPVQEGAVVDGVDT